MRRACTFVGASVLAVAATMTTPVVAATQVDHETTGMTFT